MVAGLSAEQVRHLLDRPAASQTTVVRLGDLGRDARMLTPYRHHLSLSFSSALASTPFADTQARVLDVASIMVKLGTLQRTATHTIQEASRVNEEHSDDFICDRHR